MNAEKRKKLLGLSLPVWVLMVFMLGALTGAWATERTWGRTHVCFTCNESAVDGMPVIHEECAKAYYPDPPVPDVPPPPNDTL